VLPEAEPPIVVPDELGVEALELPLEPGVVVLLPALPLVCEPVAPEPPLAVSPPLPQADRDSAAAAMTARVAPREKEETFMLNSLVGIVREDREEKWQQGAAGGIPHCCLALYGSSTARLSSATVEPCRTSAACAGRLDRGEWPG
jgi:hypothetical protein